MKPRSLAIAFSMLASTFAWASGAAPQPAAGGMAQIVTALESRYRGDVVGIRYDAAFAADPHAHAAADRAHFTLDQGRKWSTDEPLRINMEGIRAAVVLKRNAIHDGSLSATEYEALADTIEAHVATIVAECKLAPEADANLHLIVADLLEGADAMRGKSQTSAPSAGGIHVMRALDAYGRYFDHPGWKPLG